MAVLIILFIWTAISIPSSLIVGKMLARKSSTFEVVPPVTMPCASIAS